MVFKFIKYLFLLNINLFLVIIDELYSIAYRYFKAPKAHSLTYAKSNSDQMKLDLFLPENQSKKLPLIIYMHGGAYLGGTMKSIQPAVVDQIKRGYALASIDYSFIQEAAWPAQIHELKAAIRFLKSEANNYGLDADNFILWGVSAGAHLASMAGVNNFDPYLEGDLGYKEHSSKVKGSILWYPPIDLQTAGCNPLGNFELKWAVKLFQKSAENDIKKFAYQTNPINYFSSETAPFHISHGTLDRIVNIRQSRLFHNSLQENKLESTYQEIKGFAHGELRFNKKEYTKSMESFIDRMTQKSNNT